MASLVIYKLARAPGGKRLSQLQGINNVFGGTGKVRGPQMRMGRTGWEEESRGEVRKPSIELRGYAGPGL